MNRWEREALETLGPEVAAQLRPSPRLLSRLDARIMGAVPFHPWRFGTALGAMLLLSLVSKGADELVATFVGAGLAVLVRVLTPWSLRVQMLPLLQMVRERGLQAQWPLDFTVRQRRYLEYLSLVMRRDGFPAAVPDRT